MTARASIYRRIARARSTSVARTQLLEETIGRRFSDSNDRASEAADVSDESLLRYDQLLESEADFCGVPADLLRAICWYASGWRQFEPSGRPLSTPSEHGKRWGCMQLSDHWHPDAFPDVMNDARANIRYAANLLYWLREQTDSWNKATVAFFGHDARAERAAKRVRNYRSERPWELRLNPIGIDQDAVTEDDLYADLAL